jgi:hypothetical protein
MTFLPSFLRSWLRDVGGRAWIALATLVAVVGLIQLWSPLHKHLSWLALAVVALAGIAILSVIAYKGTLDRISELRSEVASLNARIQDLEGQPARSEVPPPGGGIPFIPTVDHQVDALCQVIAKLQEMGQTAFGYSAIENVLKDHQRRGTDRVFEPLAALSCSGGIKRLLELGEIEALSRPEGELVSDPDLGQNGAGWVNYNYRAAQRE